MPTLQLDLKGRKDSVYVHDVDKHEEKDDWLVIYSGDKEVGRYRMTDLAGYHFVQERDISI